ncbi:phosphotransferase system lactose/cellobiose-specific IIB subunit [Coriobacterium glomerans PW2]|uniref:Phosphotransferase system lactose/cellobiose-specific IIB subunit n=1 Tax=Coriobacterium glomerans (strain ATCC 49209 / DSM 20642 / JCM 10262 / PW2) TaxID=700015 RepID=F2NB84_CORGP|nr:PTS sugar transporter subunit IIB [Coriobacterium glomerans]AEB06620.1 phosphotransferase system lactose/cellobiose-specific IIB subunit [Coriobacterium glomerans PW2]
MKKIMLVCNAGMSTGIMAKKIEEAAEGHVDVLACGEADFENHVEGVDMILVGPQIRYLVPNIQQIVSCPVEFIAPQAYGMMDGAAVLRQIIERIGDDDDE